MMLLLAALAGCSSSPVPAPAPPAAPEAAPSPAPAPSRQRSKGKNHPRGKAKGKGRPGKGRPYDNARCKVGAWVAFGKAPAAILDAPGGTPIGDVPTDHYYTHASVRARQGRFLQVEALDVRIPKDGAEGGPLPLRGWMDRSTLDIHVEPCHNGDTELMPRLHARPSLEAAVTHRFDDAAPIEKLHGCEGSWWEVEDAAGHRGWVPAGMWCEHAQTNCLRQCTNLD